MEQAKQEIGPIIHRLHKESQQERADSIEAGRATFHSHVDRDEQMLTWNRIKALHGLFNFHHEFRDVELINEFNAITRSDVGSWQNAQGHDLASFVRGYLAALISFYHSEMLPAFDLLSIGAGTTDEDNLVD